MDESSFQTTTLHDLLDRMAAGDAAAGNELLRRAGGRLERLAGKMLLGFPTVQGWAETGDVLQNAVLRLLRALREVRPASTRDFFGLAAEQMRRELLDLARRFRGRVANQVPAGPDDSRPALDPPDHAPAPDELERWTRFHEEVERLPAAEREVVGLIFYHGWTRTEAAQLLQVNEKTVRRRWESALLKLQGVLREGPTQD